MRVIAVIDDQRLVEKFLHRLHTWSGTKPEVGTGVVRIVRGMDQR